MTNSVPEFSSQTECFLITGSNTTEAHPLVASHVLEAKKRGAKVIVIDPRQVQIGRLADLYLRASWCARREERAAREREAQCEAVLRFERALARGDVAEEQKQTVTYLIGELYRRVGRYELAAVMFENALREPVQQEGISRLAARQKALALKSESRNMRI